MEYPTVYLPRYIEIHSFASESLASTTRKAYNKYNYE